MVGDATSLAEAVAHDYVGAEFRDNRRKNDNYIKSTCIIMDCDNDHSDDPSEWVTPEDVTEAFPSVTFGVHFSKHHNLPKGSLSARPRAHYCFPCTEITDAEEYSATKRRVYQHFPYFDANALDSARYFAGTTNPLVEWHDGTMTVTDFLDGLNAEPISAEPSSPAPASGASDLSPSTSLTVIPQGNRNSTLSGFAGRIDLVNNVIHVRRSANINKGKAIVGETKTASGKRDIPIAPDLLNNLKPLKTAGYVIVGTRDQSGTEPITCTIYVAMLKRINKVIDMHGATAHVFRHSLGTLLYDASQNVKTVQSIMGHSDFKTTTDRYVHAVDERKQTAIQQVDSLISQSTASNGA